MACSIPPELTDDQISAALDGVDDSIVQAHLAQCPGCRARLDAAQKAESWLYGKLSRWDCPSTQVLGEYVLGLLDDRHKSRIETHMMECPRCREEVELLRQFIATDTVLSKPTSAPSKTINQRRRNEWYLRTPQIQLYLPHEGRKCWNPLCWKWAI